ncbi:MAG: DegQ family serine endoprotease [Proteobacteria bacterium]|nr:MAG: DegQ family serine endoprotease [Pseudomonadota bacterium]QKK12728.1 MAG: DegQ family serine endoprotease [Pseudomonadota bacterium]
MSYSLLRTSAWVILPLLLIAQEVQARSLPDFTKLVEQNSAAVVNISTTQKVQRSNRIPPGLRVPELPENSPFGDLFRHFFGEEGEGGIPEEFDSKSLGSGFFISKDGFLLTNAHVVKGADEIIVRLSDRRELEAKVIGFDERSDIALLKVTTDGDLPVVRMGSSGDLKVGEWVLAIGSPFGFDHSVTAGIVSAKGRSLPRENYVPFIQTDVAINPGNSGGPLFNLDGEVIGINSQIYSRTGGFMGLSFAIPMDVAMNVVEQLKTRGKVVRGWLGVLIQDVTRELAESFGLDKPRGALVARVLPDSPAAEAGFEVGDVVLEFNGREVSSSSALPPLVGQTPVGNSVPVKVLRNGRTTKLSVKIGELPAEDEVRVSQSQESKRSTNRLGIEVEELTKEQRQELGLDKGALIVKSLKEGPAQAAGVRAGDVITSINNEKITGLKQFNELVDKLPKGKSVAVLVYRKTGPMFLAMKIPE